MGHVRSGCLSSRVVGTGQTAIKRGFRLPEWPQGGGLRPFLVYEQAAVIGLTVNGSLRQQSRGERTLRMARRIHLSRIRALHTIS